MDRGTITCTALPGRSNTLISARHVWLDDPYLSGRGRRRSDAMRAASKGTGKDRVGRSSKGRRGCPSAPRPTASRAGADGRQRVVGARSSVTPSSSSSSDVKATDFLRSHLKTLAPYTPIEPFEVLSQKLGRCVSPTFFLPPLLHPSVPAVATEGKELTPTPLSLVSQKLDRLAGRRATS